MKAKLDENLPLQIATRLRELGHDVHTAEQENLSGCGDSELWAHAQQEGRTLITQDLILGQPSLHSWYPSRCRAGSVALTQPTAIGERLKRYFREKRSTSGRVLCCRDRSEDSCAPHPEPTDLSLPLDYVEPLHCDPDNPRVWNTRMRIWPSMSCIIKDCAHEKNHTSIRGKK